MVPVPGIIRGTRDIRIIRKKRSACFYTEPRIRFYTRPRKFKNEVTNRRGKMGPFLNLKKYGIINGLNDQGRRVKLEFSKKCSVLSRIRLCFVAFCEKGPFLNHKKSCIINGLTYVLNRSYVIISLAVGILTCSIIKTTRYQTTFENAT